MLEYLPDTWHAPWATQLPLDATDIHRPFGDVTMNGHIGSHEEAIDYLVRAHGLPDGSWLRLAVKRIGQLLVGEVHERVEAGLTQPRRGRAVAAPLVAVLVYCTHGKHRSVGLAHLLAKAFQGAGFERCEEQHLSHQMWSRRNSCGNGYICRGCDPNFNSPRRFNTLAAITALAREELDEVNELTR